MVGSFGTVNSYYYPNINTAGTKIYVPVKPSHVIYSQFKHISGVPAEENQQGVAINKVEILNKLIEQLVSMKSKNVITKTNPNVKLNEKQVDALIKDYQTQIQNTLQLAKTIPYAMKAGTAPSSGVVFNLTV